MQVGETILGAVLCAHGLVEVVACIRLRNDDAYLERIAYANPFVRRKLRRRQVELDQLGREFRVGLIAQIGIYVFFVFAGVYMVALGVV